MNQYIDKEKGLEDAGLEKGAKVRLVVESIEKRRFSLDFTDDAKQTAREESESNNDSSDTNNQLSVNDGSGYSKSEDELLAWAEYANQIQDGNDEMQVDDDHGYGEEEDDDDDQYDEDMDLAESFGLDGY